MLCFCAGLQPLNIYNNVYTNQHYNMSTVWRGAGDKLRTALLRLIPEDRTPRPGLAPLDRVVCCPAASVLRLCLVFICKDSIYFPNVNNKGYLFNIC